jgi:hypothetical protein
VLLLNLVPRLPTSMTLTPSTAEIPHPVIGRSRPGQLHFSAIQTHRCL